MKKILSCFMITMMMFTLPLVSYGSDEAPTAKPENDCFTIDQVILIDNVVCSFETIETINLYSMDNTTYEYLIDIPTDLLCTSIMLSTKVIKYSPPILTETIDKPNFYINPTLSAPKRPDLTGNESNHVGKLIYILNYNLSTGNENSYLPPIYLE